MKSGICFGDMFEQSIIESAELYAAENSGNYYSKNIADYGFSISPQVRMISSKKCDKCTGEDGVPKNIYRTMHEACEIADFIYCKRGIALKVYNCREENGWHLTA